MCRETREELVRLIVKNGFVYIDELKSKKDVSIEVEKLGIVKTKKNGKRGFTVPRQYRRKPALRRMYFRWNLNFA